MEFLYSDEGQNIWLKGYCHPIRYDDLVAPQAVPAEQLGQAAGRRRAPSSRRSTSSTAATDADHRRWDDRVGVDVVQ